MEIYGKSEITLYNTTSQLQTLEHSTYDTNLFLEVRDNLIRVSLKSIQELKKSRDIIDRALRCLWKK